MNVLLSQITIYVSHICILLVYYNTYLYIYDELITTFFLFPISWRVVQIKIDNKHFKLIRVLYVRFLNVNRIYAVIRVYYLLNSRGFTYPVHIC